MGTAAQESRLSYLHQIGGGPALGLWQMEPTTHDDIWVNWLAGKDQLQTYLMHLCRVARDQALPHPPADTVLFNLRYGAAMCRVHYAPSLARSRPHWKGRQHTGNAGTTRRWVTALSNSTWRTIVRSACDYDNPCDCECERRSGILCRGRLVCRCSQVRIHAHGCSAFSLHLPMTASRQATYSRVATPPVSDQDCNRRDCGIYDQSPSLLGLARPIPGRQAYECMQGNG